ncbi:MAG: recombinase family protein [Alphaproteobacteria bacterium]|nr:recombinase family protein [Alphaproteobacteria bacterium]
MSPPKRSLRCAIYTRKSTEEGLDQAFNSLHAQREACEAYVKSQAGEGWALVRTIYDDGGYSGGSMERPALQSLLTEIDGGHVDVVVVYKVDRLTRSLTDFAKIVERFDKRGVSFVSVTQSFNTTTSMGRLTLNVLLSFAQFEREVAGERIRDKLSASRKKGMWMGGSVPMGYDVVQRKLVPNPTEAEKVRQIFRRYVELGSTRELRLALKADGIVSQRRTAESGRTTGGNPFSRGALNHMIRNRVYVGEVFYKGGIYPGQHEAIVDRPLFDEAQAVVDEKRRVKLHRPSTTQKFPLTSLIFDDRGHPMAPSQSQKGGNRRYRYYVSRALIDKDRGEAGSIPRVPARAIEDIVIGAMHRIFELQTSNETGSDAIDLVARTRTTVRRIEVGASAIVLRLDPEVLDDHKHATHHDAIDALRSRLATACVLDWVRDDLVLSIPIRAKFRGGQHHIIAPGFGEMKSFPKPDATMVRAIVRAHAWLKLLLDGTVASMEDLALHVRHERVYVRRILRLAFLSPTITSDIIEGRQPEYLSLTDFIERDLPKSWRDQLDMVLS